MDHPAAPKDLAEAILAIAGRRGVFSEEARRRAVMQFDVHTWLDRHQQVFETLLAEKTVI